MIGRLAVLPFRWSLIDAFHYLPNFAERRQAVRGSSEPLPPAALRDCAGNALQKATADGAVLVLLFHPFLTDTDERRATMRAVLSDVRRRVAQDDVWCVPLRDIAARLRAQPGASAGDVRLDET